MAKHLPSTQRYLDVAEVRDDVLVMKDGDLRAVLLTSSINFGLKSEDEQNAVVQSYVSFLNSLDATIQIVIQSRRLNIDKYLESLETIEREQTNELLRVQIADYRQFVRELVSLGEIMTKRFFVVVPQRWEGGQQKPKGFTQRLREVVSPTTLVRLKEEKFQKNRSELLQRVEEITGGLTSMGLHVEQLNTQQLIESLYTTYNPDLAEPQHLTDLKTLAVET